MKKTIICTICFVLAVVIFFAVFSGIKYYANRSGETGNENEDYEEADLITLDDLLFASNFDELKKVADKCNLVLDTETDPTSVIINNVVLHDITSDMSYWTNEHGSFSQLNVYIPPFSEDYKNLTEGQNEFPSHTGGELRQKTEKIVAALEAITGAVIGDNYYIISISDGKVIDNDEDASFDKILSGEAYFLFSMRLSDGTYLCLYSEMPENYVYYKITRYFDATVYADSIVNISMQ